MSSMITEEKLVEEQRSDDPAEDISSQWLLLRDYFAHSDLDSRELKEIVKLLKTWREKNDLNEEYFKAYLEVFLSLYVQSDIEKRFERFFSDKLLSTLSSK